MAHIQVGDNGDLYLDYHEDAGLFTVTYTSSNFKCFFDLRADVRDLKDLIEKWESQGSDRSSYGKEYHSNHGDLMLSFYDRLDPDIFTISGKSGYFELSVKEHLPEIARYIKSL